MEVDFMNTLLNFFAFPIAVIIISIILQKILDNPIAVAAAIFAFFIVITFAFFDETFLIATLVYTILAFITAFLVSRICDDNHNHNNSNNCLCNAIADILRNNTNLNTTNNAANASLQDLLNNVNSSNNCGGNGNNNDNDDVLGISNNNTCGCGRVRRYRKY